MTGEVAQAIVGGIFVELMQSGEVKDLADGIVQGGAAGDQFRTAPLWGVGQRLYFLHDGRTSDILQAILDHSSRDCRQRNCQSEADGVIHNFESLSASEMQDLLNFLRSL